MKKTIVFGLLFALISCGHIDPSITDQTRVYSDPTVRKSPLQVAVHPKGRQYRPLTAYFHPFIIQQENSDYAQLSVSFARIFNNVWLEERLFSTMEFRPENTYQGVNTALRQARMRGADLTIVGYVPYFYAGHTLDDTAITIQIDIYETASGTLVWTMLQSGRIESKLPKDYIYFRHEFRMTDAPFDMIIRSIASDMAIPLKAWLPSPDADFAFAGNARDVTASLTGTPPASASATGGEADLPPEPVVRKPAPVATAAGHPEDTRPHVNGVNLDIQFDFNKDTIRPESYPLLDALGEALNADDLRGRKIIVGGHTDSRGDENYNLALSKRRAEAVKTYLVNKWGVAPSQIETAGYGKTRPIATGSTAEDMRKNRRVEVRLAE
ncbi:OmpA family protein [Pseudodesulfovibrio sp. F-1]|uniref:OmpA family protein n=1 Tax=Pseudodesulfovibrio alkaliphilus TaxID=2661613 RepID=A0A7K1KJ97_9BACT|nr:OmpA family protein [Pseudodesulfovibrio alkaliphilus]MUM76134.1 OmpA family protein [Pseudodesulfovibrio alkaliphilus]